MLFWRKISPANGYCLFFPNRPAGKRFVAGQSVRVGPWTEWKHVKLGLFFVRLPEEKQKLLVTTAEQLTCGIDASFGIVIGGPEEGREDRLAKATISCPAKQSMADADRVQLDPFFHDWAKNYCQTAIINTIKERQFIQLIEDPNYRQQAEKDIEKVARDTLAQIGMLLVQCTVVVQPNEPTGVFATREILEQWEQYRKTVSNAELKKLQADNADKEAKAKENTQHAQRLQQLAEAKTIEDAADKQKIDFKLRDLALELKRKESALAIQESTEISDKDKQISVIKEEMAHRAQEAQLQRIRREADLEQEKERKAKELADLKRQQEISTIAHRLKLLADEKVVAEKELEILVPKEKLNAAAVDLDRRKGEVKAKNIQEEVLARGAHEMQLRQLMFNALPTIVEHASRPIEKIGEIRMINLSGVAQGAEATCQSGIGSILASASTLPIVRELFRFLNEIERTSGLAGAAGALADVADASGTPGSLASPPDRIPQIASDGHS